MNAQLQQPASDNFLTDDASITRYRRAILRLSDAMVCAAGERVDLSPLLLEALNHALENLLLYGDVAALESLEEWLDDGEIVTGAPRDTGFEESLPAPKENNSAVFSECRADAERRATDVRRKSDRRNTPQDEGATHPDERRARQRRTSRDRRS